MNYRDYRGYSPGLQRRMSYSYYLTRRSFNINLSRNNWDLSNLTTQLNIISNQNGDTFNNLIDIEKGIISKNLIEKSKVIIYGSRSIEFCSVFCSVCRSNFENVDIVRIIGCNHIYHIDCIDTWFTKNKTCPECRYEI